MASPFLDSITKLLFSVIISDAADTSLVEQDPPLQQQKSSLPLQRDEQDSSLPEQKNKTEWDAAATRFLITQYKDNEEKMNSGRMRKKAFWALVSSELAKINYEFTPQQTEGRWKTIMTRYKAVKESPSGSARKDFEFEEDLDSIYEGHPNIIPKVTISNTEGKKGAKKHKKSQKKDKSLKMKKQKRERNSPEPKQSDKKDKTLEQEKNGKKDKTPDQKKDKTSEQEKSGKKDKNPDKKPAEDTDQLSSDSDSDDIVKLSDSDDEVPIKNETPRHL